MMPPGQQRPPSDSDRSSWLYVLLLAAFLWLVNAFWLGLDTRPPVWDMALHQTYALNYLPGSQAEGQHYWEKSGNYPPFVHLMISLCFFLFGPAPDVAALANIPATLLLFWGIYALGRASAGESAARWACFFAAMVPILLWYSRETILDYWLSAWFVAFLVVLRRTDGFASLRASVLLGVIVALGLLTKWFFAAYAVFPMAFEILRHRTWSRARCMRNLADCLLTGSLIAGIWYFPMLPRLAGYFSANMQVGAREGEPAVWSFQSWIYYLRLLEGYQLQGVMFGFLALAAFFVWRRRLMRDGDFLLCAIAGGWLAMTLLRTKDPRFTMPLLGLLAIPCGVWIASWGRGWKAWALRVAVCAVLAVQAYAINFGISWLPEEVVIARGYQGSLRWDWNFFMQHYFHILGPPRREAWRQAEIVRRIAQHGGENQIPLSLAVIPDLPRFNAANFLLESRIAGIGLVVDHPQPGEATLHALDNFNYVLMTEGDQGMSWTTAANGELNRMIVDNPHIFQFLEEYELPGGDRVRLYRNRAREVSLD